MALCHGGCGTTLAPNKAPGRARKWCSERCRRRTLYGGRCEDCGATTCNGGAPPQPRRCLACASARKHAERHWTPEAIREALRAWAAEHGRTPTVPETVGDRALPPFATAQREFGSWNAALEAAGLPLNRPSPPGPNTLTEEKLAATVALYREHGSGPVVARLLGITQRAVYGRLDKAGVERRAA